jgi:catechol 2,3-dioxygenase-like lactoylglutathione lyase family enzyme
MKIKVISVYVDDQEKALRFYTEVLGFTKKTDFSQGPSLADRGLARGAGRH